MDANKKYCSKCRIDKNKSEFYKDENQKSGLRPDCKICVRERQNLRYHKSDKKNKLEYNKKYRQTENGKNILKKSIKKYRLKNIEKDNANNILQYNVQRKKIIKPNICSICLQEFPKNKIHGHHQDYNKPLEVIWCCDICHKNLHKLNNKPEL